MEILVVDGMSTDHTRETIKAFQLKHANIKLIDNPGKIVPTGMNIALQRAKGDIIIRVDGHCVVAPDYVQKCVEHLEKDGVDGVGGPMETMGEDALARTIDRGYEFLVWGRQLSIPHYLRKNHAGGYCTLPRLHKINDPKSRLI